MKRWWLGVCLDLVLCTASLSDADDRRGSPFPADLSGQCTLRFLGWMQPLGEIRLMAGAVHIDIRVVGTPRVFIGDHVILGVNVKNLQTLSTGQLWGHGDLRIL